MNLLCPSCQKMLQVSEQAAGQQMRCPLCNNTFTVPPLPDAPSLAPSPPLPPPPPAPPPLPAPAAAEAYTLADDPNALPMLTASAPAPVPVPSRTPAPPPPPPVVGDYTKLRSIVISPRVVPWIAPIALLVLFLLTFFPWFRRGQNSFNAWSLGFSKVPDILKDVWPGGALFIFYDLFIIFGVLLAVASLLMHLKIIPDIPALQPIHPWRAVIILGFVGTAYLLLFLNLLVGLFDLGGIWLNFWGWLAETAHCIAVFGLLLEMWLQLRGPTRPPPRIDIHT